MTHNLCINKVLFPSVRYQTIINRAIKPLKELLGFSYFYFFKVTNEGKYSFFGNHIDWGQNYFTHKLYLKDFHCFKPCNFKMGSNITLLHDDRFFNAEIRNTAVNTFHINHIFEIGHRFSSSIEFYGFGADSNKTDYLSHYLNELPLLKMFIKKLPEKIPTVYNVLKESSFNMACELGSSFYTSDFFPRPNINRNHFLKEIGINPSSKLSKREMDVAQCLIKGCTAREIGVRLDLSKRTIESYIENLKGKLECYSKHELIQKCLELESIEYFPHA